MAERNLSEKFCKYRDLIYNRRKNNPYLLWIIRFLNEFRHNNNNIGWNETIKISIITFINTIYKRNNEINNDEYQQIIKCTSCEKQYRKLLLRKKYCGICKNLYCHKCINKQIDLIKLINISSYIDVNEHLSQLKGEMIKNDKKNRKFSRIVNKQQPPWILDVCDNCELWSRVYMFKIIVNEKYHHPIENIHHELMEIIIGINRHLKSFENQIELFENHEISTEMHDIILQSCNALENELAPIFSRLFTINDILDNLKDDYMKNQNFRTRAELIFDRDVVKNMKKLVMQTLKHQRPRYKRCKAYIQK